MSGKDRRPIALDDPKIKVFAGTDGKDVTLCLTADQDDGQWFGIAARMSPEMAERLVAKMQVKIAEARGQS